EEDPCPAAGPEVAPGPGAATGERRGRSGGHRRARWQALESLATRLAEPGRSAGLVATRRARHGGPGANTGWLGLVGRSWWRTRWLELRRMVRSRNAATRSSQRSSN